MSEALARVLNGSDFVAAAPRRTPLETGAARAWIAPVALLLASPLCALSLWMICVQYGGSSLAFARDITPAKWWQLLPAPSLAAVEIFVLWTAFQLLLLKVLPGATLRGPVTPTGQQPIYKLNGIGAWVVSHAVVIGAVGVGWLPASYLYDHFGELLSTLCVSAFVFCLFLYWKGRFAPSTSDAVYTGNFAFDFFQGVELHPTLFGVNLKQLFNCRVSMMGWSLTTVLFAAHQWATSGLTIALTVSVLLTVIYLFKFFWWEGGYFHSLDIMHDRFGYYICWGVLVWVPAIYTSPALYLSGSHGDIALWQGVAILALGIAAIIINYAADAQRQRVRQTAGKTLVWGKAPTLINARYTTTDGVQRENLLLVSGYWKLARHFHYVPELTLAFAWSLPAGFDNVLAPYAYFMFLCILLFDRSRRDDARCRAKYGAHWDEYCRAVPYKIVPFIY